MCKENLKRLICLVNEACTEAFNDSTCQTDAINWGDLGCVEARLCANEEGATWYHVLIEEASPGSSGLIQFVMTYLAEHEYAGVEVETAW